MDALYENIIRPVFFTQDPEVMHEMAIRAMQVVGVVPPLRSFMEALNFIKTPNPVNLFGLNFPNRVGLAAGFDKDAECWRAAGAFGFGHIEIGTVTMLKQPGNPRPRMFRYPSRETVVNCCGFPNDGAEEIAQRLSKSMGRAFLPNLLGAVVKANSDRAKKLGVKRIPIILKIAPDLTFADIDAIISILDELGLDGICATNTTTWRPWQDIEKSGGMSGKPLFEKSLEIVRYISKVTDGKLPIIGVGGIVDLDSAGKMMNAGASLVQVYTGMVFRGPFFARSLAKSLIWRDSNWV